MNVARGMGRWRTVTAYVTVRVMAIRWTPVDACLAKLSPFHDESGSIESNKGIRGSFVPFYDFDKINQNAKNAK